MNPEDFHADEDDEYLTRVVIDTCARTFYMYSNEGGKRKIVCDSVDEFMTVLELVRTCLLYTSPSPRDLSTSRMPSSA